jgi:hypothetical protein
MSEQQDIDNAVTALTDVVGLVASETDSLTRPPVQCFPG